MRYRHDHLLGLDYQSVDELREALAALSRDRRALPAGRALCGSASSRRRGAARDDSAASPSARPELALGAILRALCGTARVQLDQLPLEVARLLAGPGREPVPRARPRRAPRSSGCPRSARSSTSISSARSSGALDRHGHLDAVVEVARHQVRGGDVDGLLALALEGVDARVLEQAPDDRDHADVLRDARHARAQAADAAHVQLHAHARAARRHRARGCSDRRRARSSSSRSAPAAPASAPRSCARSRR